MKDEVFKSILRSAVASLSTNMQNRISHIVNLGDELRLIDLKESKQPSRTRTALQELAKRVQMYKENKVSL